MVSRGTEVTMDDEDGSESRTEDVDAIGRRIEGG